MAKGRKKTKRSVRALAGTVFGMAFGIALAFSGVIFLRFLLDRQEQFWLSGQTKAEVQTGTAMELPGVSYSPEEYAAIILSQATDDKIYYHEPFGKQISMREALEEGKKILNLFFGSETMQEYNVMLTSAQLSSRIVDYYDWPQYSFWTLTLSGEWDFGAEVMVNALDGRVWSVCVEFSFDSPMGTDLLNGSLYEFVQPIYQLSLYRISSLKSISDEMDSVSGEFLDYLFADAQDISTECFGADSFYRLVEDLEQKLQVTESAAGEVKTDKDNSLSESSVSMSCLAEELMEGGLWSTRFDDALDLGVYFFLSMENQHVIAVLSFGTEEFTTMSQLY